MCGATTKAVNLVPIISERCKKKREKWSPAGARRRWGESTRGPKLSSLSGRSTPRPGVACKTEINYHFPRRKIVTYSHSEEIENFK